MHLHRGELHLVGKAFSKRRCRWVHCYDTTTSKLSAKMFSFHFLPKSLVKIGKNQDFPSFFCFDCWQIVFLVAVEGGQARARWESQLGEEAGKTIHLRSGTEMLEWAKTALKVLFWKLTCRNYMPGSTTNAAFSSYVEPLIIMSIQKTKNNKAQIDAKKFGPSWLNINPCIQFSHQFVAQTWHGGPIMSGLARGMLSHVKTQLGRCGNTFCPPVPLTGESRNKHTCVDRKEDTHTCASWPTPTSTTPTS